MRKFLCFVLTFFVLSTVVCADRIDSAIENGYETDKNYTDLDSVPWAKDAIIYLADFGVIHQNNGKVEPQRYINRSEFVELIVGSFGLYDYSADCDFEDVDKTSFYYPYIASAYKCGIINGTSEKRFGAREYLSRQDMATIIYRTAVFCGIDLSEKSELSFSDNDQISSYAYDAISSLVSAKAVSGTENNKFLPKKLSTFAESCKIVYYVLLKNT